MKSSRIVLSLLVLCASAQLACIVPATAAELSVPMDEVRMLTFETPVKTVFVGNPLIADVTVVDSTHVFLMGKNFGTTNVMALDDSGQAVLNDRVTVLARAGETVTVQRGTARTTLSCPNGHCEASPVPGDDAKDFNAVTGQVDKREAAAHAVATGGAGQ